MQNIKFFFVVLISSSLFFNCNEKDSDTNPPEPLDYYEALNVAYGEHYQQVFDIYLPANRTTATKTIILVHGGGWTAGDKNDMNGFVEFLLQELPEYAIVNLNYRLATTSLQAHPMQINDITAAVNFLKDNTSTYTISENLGFIGTSAGAHLSLLWSYAFDTESNVNMVCSIVGPTNFTDPNYLNSTNSELLAMLQALGGNTSTSFLEEVSPYHQVDETAPPTQLFYGGLDPLVPTSQGVLLRDKLETLNVIHEFTLYENEAHGWVGENLIDTTTKLKAFLKTYLD